MFLNDETFNAFINPCPLSKSSVFRKYINKQKYQLSNKAETKKGYEEVKSLIKSVLNIKINNSLDLIRGDVRLNEFRSTDSLKRLKKALSGLKYDFCIIDTSPTYDNIIGNVLTASDILLIPVQQDIFSYQAVKYQFEKLVDLELDIDTHIIFNQFEKPLNDNQNSYRNQITNMFLNDEDFKDFINPCHISRSSVFRKYINGQNYQITDKAETRKGYEEVKALIKSVLNIDIKEGI
jgi:chromosome partitioning protein